MSCIHEFHNVSILDPIDFGIVLRWPDLVPCLNSVELVHPDVHRVDGVVLSEDVSCSTFLRVGLPIHVVRPVAALRVPVVDDPAAISELSSIHLVVSAIGARSERQLAVIVSHFV